MLSQEGRRFGGRSGIGRSAQGDDGAQAAVAGAGLEAQVAAEKIGIAPGDGQAEPGTVARLDTRRAAFPATRSGATSPVRAG